MPDAGHAPNAGPRTPCPPAGRQLPQFVISSCPSVTVYYSMTAATFLPRRSAGLPPHTDFTVAFSRQYAKKTCHHSTGQPDYLPDTPVVTPPPAAAHTLPHTVTPQPAGCIADSPATTPDADPLTFRHTGPPPCSDGHCYGIPQFTWTDFLTLPAAHLDLRSLTGPPVHALQFTVLDPDVSGGVGGDTNMPPEDTFTLQTWRTGRTPGDTFLEPVATLPDW